MKPNYFSIPKPCSEDWSKMTPTEQGAFCKVCSQEVVDLSKTKSAAIKKTIVEKNQPCIRILQRQIDEMNFTEWFTHLTLRKQLKYVFLFALLFVFNFGGIAQDDDTDGIPYLTEKIQEEGPFPKNEQLDIALIEETTDTISDTTDLLPFIITGTFNGGGVGENWPYEGITWMGIPPMQPQIFRFDETLIASVDLSSTVIGGYFLPVQQFDEINFGENQYSFRIQEDTLYFTYHSKRTENVNIKIQHSTTMDVVYFNPLRIPVGQREIPFSLENFSNGEYTITLETDTESKTIELTYW